MGFLDGILGALAGQNGSLGQAAINLVQSHGGLNGLLEQLKRCGLGAEAESWVSTGSNLPVSGEQLRAALGSPQVQQLAARFGLSPEAIASGLAQVLPTVVDHLTPNGQVPEGAALDNALTHLKSRLGS